MSKELTPLAPLDRGGLKPSILEASLLGASCLEASCLEAFCLEASPVKGRFGGVRVRVRIWKKIFCRS